MSWSFFTKQKDQESAKQTPPEDITQDFVTRGNFSVQIESKLQDFTAKFMQAALKIWPPIIWGGQHETIIILKPSSDSYADILLELKRLLRGHEVVSLYIRQFDQRGNVILQWHLRGCTLTFIDCGDLSAGDPNQIEITLRFNVTGVSLK